MQNSSRFAFLLSKNIFAQWLPKAIRIVFSKMQLSEFAYFISNKLQTENCKPNTENRKRPSAFYLSDLILHQPPTARRKPPFAFCLSPFITAFCFLLFALSSSCTNNPNYQGKGQLYLQGEWRQDSVPAEKQLLTYSLYDLKFDCDSFFFKIYTHSKVNYGADTCMNAGHWTEYVKGSYQQRHDTVFMDGGFCNPDYTLKGDGGCFRTGVYREFFVLKAKKDSAIEFLGSTTVIPIKARLIKKTTCTPKPI
jgi:hypothetical protein